MEIVDAYRKARRNTSIFCGIALAWSAAQFDLKSFDTGVGKVDISGASIPIILACLIIYTMARCTIEFMMQPNEIRRWNLAQVDYKITLNLARISLLALAASTVFRSIVTVVGVAVASLALIIIYIILVVFLMFIIMPIRLQIRSRQGRVSAASSAVESGSWSIFIVTILYILFFTILGLSPPEKLPVMNILLTVPSQISTMVFTITAIIIGISFFIEAIMRNKLYAFEPKTVIVESKLPDGTIGVAFKDNPNHPDHITSATSNETQKKSD